MSEMKSLTLNGKKYDSFVDQTAREEIKKIQNSGQNVTLSTAQIDALHGMFKVCLFDDSKDVDGAIAVFEAAFALSDSGESGGGEDSGETVTTYTITNDLSHVKTDNDAVSIESGKMYTANLTAESGYTIESVVVTMGGNTISAYGDGAVSVDSVTGDIVITATATQMHTDAPVYQLASELIFDGTAAHDTGHALWGGANADFTICLDFTDAATPKTTYPMYIVGQTFTAAYLYFYKTYTGGAFNARYNSGAATAIGIASGAEHAKIVVSHAAGQTGITVHTASGDTPLASSSNYPTNDAATVQLGANGFTGTVHDFRVYDRVLVADEINEYLGVE